MHIRQEDKNRLNLFRQYIKSDLTKELKKDYDSLNTSESIDNLFEYKPVMGNPQNEYVYLSVSPRNPIDVGAKKLTESLKNHIFESWEKAKLHYPNTN